MSTAQQFLVWFSMGCLLGGIYLAILWVSVEQAIRQRAVRIWIAGAAARLSFLMAAGLLAFQLHPSASLVVAATAGFALVRCAVVGAVRSVISGESRDAEDGDLT